MSLLRKKVRYPVSPRPSNSQRAALFLGLALLVSACGDTTATVNPATTSATIAPPTATGSVAPATASTTAAIVATQAIATNTVGTVTAVPATAIPVTTTPALKAIVQPKVIRTASDSYRKTIQFTEQPASLNDGIPSLFWFDAEG